MKIQVKTLEPRESNGYAVMLSANDPSGYDIERDGIVAYDSLTVVFAGESEASAFADELGGREVKPCYFCPGSTAHFVIYTQPAQD